jgi:hypothetical protein
MRNAHLRIEKVALAVANNEHTQIDIDISVSGDGEKTVHFVTKDERLRLNFDELAWYRLKRAIGQVDETFAELEQRGITFRVGGVHEGVSLDHPDGQATT